ncbi:hypothetical protein BDZ89DRAFT_1132734 [Hymenopellis radicata]|nr:hypothetical protein BDZ89DRAFT_1132734 [Hymenopellis radicata]
MEGIVSSSAEPWFKEALQKTMEKGSVRGVKSAMIAHLISCENASVEAKRVAKREKGGAAAKEDDPGTEADDESESAQGPLRKKRKIMNAVQKKFTQTELKVFTGINIPFTPKQKAAIELQFGLIALLHMFRATAEDVIPDRRQVSGRILNELGDAVDAKIKNVLHGAYITLSSDGWDDNSRTKVTGVHAAAKGKTFLINVVNSNRARKDGEGIRDLNESDASQTRDS